MNQKTWNHHTDAKMVKLVQGKGVGDGVQKQQGDPED